MILNDLLQAFEWCKCGWNCKTENKTEATSDKTKTNKIIKANCSARVATESCTQKDTKNHVTIIFNIHLEIQQGSTDCRDTCACKISSSWVQRFMSYQQCTRFQTTLDFDCEYLWNGSSNRQAKNGVINYDFFHVGWKQFAELWSTNKKYDVDLWPWNSIGFGFMRYMLVQNFIQLSAAVHELSLG